MATSDDRGRYLTNLDGATHELFGGDPEEIVLRVARVGEGARSLRDFARDVRSEADRYERLQRDGWRLVTPFADGQARCRKAPDADDPGAGSSPSPGGRPQDLPSALQGAASLPEAAARLRAAAEGYERLEAEGRRLSEPVTKGRPPLE